MFTYFIKNRYINYLVRVYDIIFTKFLLKIKKTKRKMWVHPLNSARSSEAVFNLVFEHIR